MRMERDGELAIVRMQAGKANAMTRAMLDGLWACADLPATRRAPLRRQIWSASSPSTGSGPASR